MLLADDAASWKPTPPAYIKAIEPHWNKIRTFILDSAQQFKPLPATPFSMNKEPVNFIKRRWQYMI